MLEGLSILHVEVLEVHCAMTVVSACIITCNDRQLNSTYLKIGTWDSHETLICVLDWSDKVACEPSLKFDRQNLCVESLIPTIHHHSAISPTRKFLIRNSGTFSEWRRGGGTGHTPVHTRAQVRNSTFFFNTCKQLGHGSHNHGHLHCYCCP